MKRLVLNYWSNGLILSFHIPFCQIRAFFRVLKGRSRLQRYLKDTPLFSIFAWKWYGIDYCETKLLIKKIEIKRSMHEQDKKIVVTRGITNNSIMNISRQKGNRFGIAWQVNLNCLTQLTLGNAFSFAATIEDGLPHEQG